MLSIRLTRVGKRKESRFRIIVQEKAKAPSSSFVEILGQYNPHAESRVTNFNSERAKYWLTQGAKPSDTVYNIFVDHDLIEGEKHDQGRPKKKQARKKKESAEAGAEEVKKQAPETAKNKPDEKSKEEKKPADTKAEKSDDKK